MAVSNLGIYQKSHFTNRVYKLHIKDCITNKHRLKGIIDGIGVLKQDTVRSLY